MTWMDTPFARRALLIPSAESMGRKRHRPSPLMPLACAVVVPVLALCPTALEPSARVDTPLGERDGRRRSCALLPGVRRARRRRGGIQVRIVERVQRQKLSDQHAKFPWLAPLKARVEERLPVRFVEWPPLRRFG